MPQLKNSEPVENRQAVAHGRSRPGTDVPGCGKVVEPVVHGSSNRVQPALKPRECKRGFKHTRLVDFHYLYCYWNRLPVLCIWALTRSIGFHQYFVSILGPQRSGNGMNPIICDPIVYKVLYRDNGYLIWCVLRNLHRRAMPKDCYFVTGIKWSDLWYLLLWRSQYVSNNLSHSPTHTLPFGRYIRRFTICETNAQCNICGFVENSQIMIFISPKNVQLKPMKRPINVLPIYSVFGKRSFASVVIWSQGFHLCIS